MEFHFCSQEEKKSLQLPLTPTRKITAEPDNKTLELSARGEAEPVPESQYCSACRGYFSCYLAHIGSIQHRSNSLAQNGPFLSGIDDVIRDLEVKI